MYSLMMMLDGGWDDALGEFLEQATEEKSMEAPFHYALKRLLIHESYGKPLSEQLVAMVRDRNTSTLGLRLIAALKN
jgi:hypothetical protein